MNSRERFFTTLNHVQPDRVPINYMAKSALDLRMKRFYNINSERELLDILGCDFYFLSSRDISQNETFYPLYSGPALQSTDTERTCPFRDTF